MVAPNENDELLDAAVRNQLIEGRYAEGLGKSAGYRVLTDATRRNRLDAANVLDRTRVRRDALARWERRVRDRLKTTLEREGQRVQTAMGKAATSAAKMQREELRRILRRDVRPASKLRISQAASSSRIQGQPLSKWLSKASKDLGDESVRIMRLGLERNQPVRAILRALGEGRGALGKRAKQQVEALVRTATVQAQNRARIETLRANRKLLRGWRFTAVLDDRTTEICTSYDGQIFPIGEGPVPPLHFRCRSTVTPVALGVDDASALTRIEWLRRQPREVQDEALGKGKANLLRQGRLNADTLVRADGTPLTLEETRQKIRKASGRRAMRREAE